MGTMGGYHGDGSNGAWIHQNRPRGDSRGVTSSFFE